MEELGTTNLKRIPGNPANTYRTAGRCGIDDAKAIGKDELYARYSRCKEYTRSLMANSPWMRKQFLSEKLTEAVEQNKTEEALRLKNILKTEAHFSEVEVNH